MCRIRLAPDNKPEAEAILIAYHRFFCFEIECQREFLGRTVFSSVSSAKQTGTQLNLSIELALHALYSDSPSEKMAQELVLTFLGRSGRLHYRSS